jgi:hypothetical protein
LIGRFLQDTIRARQTPQALGGEQAMAACLKEE